MSPETTTKKSIFDTLHDEIMESDLPESEKNRRLSSLLKDSTQKVNLMLVGATGSGKSSTINALFNMNMAAVGMGVNPETTEIAKYELGNLIIWDTPGLGGGEESDRNHTEQIVRKLLETGEDGNLLIDIVLVVLDASSKDMAVSYSVINNTLIPCLGEGNTHRIIIALNQSDVAMKGRHWDYENNAPDSVLKEFLKEKSDSVRQKILDATGVAVAPVCYCAGYTEDDGTQQNPYNLPKLLFHILMAVPSGKRLVIADNLNDFSDNWGSNDNDMDYSEAVKESFLSALLVCMGDGVEKGVVTGGCILGIPGALVGGCVGGILGGLNSLIVKPMRNVFT